MAIAKPNQKGLLGLKLGIELKCIVCPKSTYLRRRPVSSSTAIEEAWSFSNLVRLPLSYASPNSIAKCLWLMSSRNGANARGSSSQLGLAPHSLFWSSTTTVNQTVALYFLAYKIVCNKSFFSLFYIIVEINVKKIIYKVSISLIKPWTNQSVNKV